jgi:hypothetical protein
MPSINSPHIERQPKAVSRRAAAQCGARPPTLRSIRTGLKTFVEVGQALRGWLRLVRGLLPRTLADEPFEGRSTDRCHGDCRHFAAHGRQSYVWILGPMGPIPTSAFCRPWATVPAPACWEQLFPVLRLKTRHVNSHLCRQSATVRHLNVRGTRTHTSVHHGGQCCDRTPGTRACTPVADRLIQSAEVASLLNPMGFTATERAANNADR